MTCNLSSYIHYIDQFYANYLFCDWDIDRFRAESYGLFKKMGWDINQMSDQELLALAHDQATIKSYDWEHLVKSLERKKRFY